MVAPTEFEMFCNRSLQCLVLKSAFINTTFLLCNNSLGMLIGGTHPPGSMTKVICKKLGRILRLKGYMVFSF